VNVIHSLGVLLGIRHKNFVIEIADAKWGVTRRKVWIGETVRINLLKIFVEGCDLPVMKICHIQKIVIIGDA
jgi:hypothetical protein